METGWNLGPFAAVLKCLNLDKHLLKKQNRNKLYRIKNNWMHAQGRANAGQKIQRDQETPTAISKQPGGKAGDYTCPLHTPHKGWANHLSHPASPAPGCTPTLTLYKGQARPSLGNKEGKVLLVFAVPVLQQGPQCSLAYISCPASSQSVLIGEGQEPWLVT